MKARIILPMAVLLAAGAARLPAQTLENARANIIRSGTTSFFSPKAARDSIKFIQQPILERRIIVKDREILQARSDTIPISQIIFGAGGHERGLGTATKPAEPLAAGTRLGWQSGAYTYALEITEMLPVAYAMNGDRTERAIGDLEIKFAQGSYKMGGQAFVLNGNGSEIEILQMPKLHGWLNKIGADMWVVQYNLIRMQPFSGNAQDLENWLGMAQDSVAARGGFPANHFTIQMPSAGSSMLYLANATALKNGAAIDTTANGIAVAIAGMESSFAGGATENQLIVLPTRAQFTDAFGTSQQDDVVIGLGNDTTAAITSYDPTPVSRIPQAGTFSISSVYPNPANRGQQVNVGINMREGSSLKVEVYDALGRRVLALPQADVNSANVTATLNVGSLPSGQYTIRAISGDVWTSRPLIIVK